LEDALLTFGDRPAVIANDLTKKFETILRGTLSELIEQTRQANLKGEYSVVIGGVGVAWPEED
jgi:16S rRNA (cytidine1402-2'-O)-methyltransferase